jgi:hypothetical protein
MQGTLQTVVVEGGAQFLYLQRGDLLEDLCRQVQLGIELVLDQKRQKLMASLPGGMGVE